MSFFGETTTTNIPAGLSPAEQEFIKTQTKLANLQLKNLQGLQPFQQKLVNQALRGITQDNNFNRQLDRLISPKERARAEAAEFERAQKLGPIQDKILKMQLKQMRQGGRATPEQLADIKAAADAGIESGSADIDLQTERGIGLIADELANSRGLRLSDTPILREATLLTRDAGDQKANLIRGLRSNEANARLNYPLAVQGLQSQINQNQQSLLQNAGQFQAELRQRAFMNRQALSGQASNTGLGLSSIGGQQPNVPHASTQSTSRSPGMSDWAQLAGGIGGLMYTGAMFSDSRLKDDLGVVGKTPGGAKVHAFKYKWDSNDDPLRLGVMAQEIEDDQPEAVLTRGDGIKLVNYDELR